MTGRVFVIGPDNKPVQVQLQLGITDGRMTEVLAGSLTERQSVITGPAPSTTIPERSSFKFQLR
jgi:HlyD family secretion protein